MILTPFRLLLVVLVLTIPSLAASADLYDLTVKDFKLAGTERIVGYKLKVTSGRIASLGKVPIGWNVTIDNDPSWNTTVTGSIIVAAAAIKPDYFSRFIQIEKFKQEGISFDFELEITTTTDFEKEKTIILGKKHLALIPAVSRK